MNSEYLGGASIYTTCQLGGSYQLVILGAVRHRHTGHVTITSAPRTATNHENS